MHVTTYRSLSLRVLKIHLVCDIPRPVLRLRNMQQLCNNYNNTSLPQHRPPALCVPTPTRQQSPTHPPTHPTPKSEPRYPYNACIAGVVEGVGYPTCRVGCGGFGANIWLVDCSPVQ